MEFVLFPHAFLDLPGVCGLPSEHKLVLCAATAHPRLSACGVLVATPYVVAGLPLPPEVFWGVVADLDRREIVAADPATCEIFVLDAFSWHRAPSCDEDSSWARQVAAATARVRSPRVGDAVRAALERPPVARIAALKIPSNLLTAMPPRGRGQAWSASETLVHFALATAPTQTAAGVFSPTWPALAAFCSLPAQTLLECVDSLGATQLVTFDFETGEVFSPARMRAASDRDIGRIQRTAESVRSWSIFRALAAAATRRFQKINLKSTCCPLGEVRGGDVSGGESVADRISTLNGRVVRDPASGETATIDTKECLKICQKTFFASQLVREIDAGRLELVA